MDNSPKPAPGKRFFIVDEERLGQFLIDYSPQIHHDVDRMEDILGELITLERHKAGFDSPCATIELLPKNDKKHPDDCDWFGQGRIAGRSYRVSARISPDQKLKIALLPPKRK